MTSTPYARAMEGVSHMDIGRILKHAFTTGGQMCRKAGRQARRKGGRQAGRMEEKKEGGSDGKAQGTMGAWEHRKAKHRKAKRGSIDE